MSVTGIPDEVRAFVREHIQSVEQLEVLLLLFRTAPREWSAVAVSRELRIDAVSAARRLADFHERGLVQARAGEDTLVYWYDGGGAGRDRVVSGLATLYRDRRTTLINLIFSTPVNDVRIFADAFRLRKRDDEGPDGAR